MIRSHRGGLPIFLGALLVVAGCRPSPDSGHSPDRETLLLATTTSVQDSGLLDELLPRFEEETGYRVKTIAVGSGEALAMGRRGDVDVLLTHAPEPEKEMVAEGFAVRRRIVMHNDFLIAGPERDPAGVHGSQDGPLSVTSIAEAEAGFASRGDNSGTHLREMRLWREAGVEPVGEWYVSTGQGMGATLMIAAELGVYVLTDRGTYLSLRHRTGLIPHVEGDPGFLNIYSVLEVNPERFPAVNHPGARAFSDFVLGREAQEAIRVFGVDRFGQPLFHPDAGKSEASLGS
jgi:tungstate transport system substrate-binding protein